MLRKRIEDTGLLEQLSAGVVLTGGAVLLDGMTEFAEEILGMPVRLGVPIGVGGISQLVAGPQYATAVGLVQYGASKLIAAREQAPAVSRGVEPRRLPARPQPEKETVEARPSGLSRLGEWIRAAF